MNGDSWLILVLMQMDNDKNNYDIVDLDAFAVGAYIIDYNDKW